MAAPVMPKDDNLVAMPVTALTDGHTLAVSGSSSRKALPGETHVAAIGAGNLMIMARV